MISLIIIDSGINRKERLFDSFKDISLTEIISLSPGELNFNISNKAIWKMFMYSNEFLSVPLKNSLSSFLAAIDYDVFSIYKLKKIDQKEPIFSYAPRIFKANLQLQRGC